jgi:DMSO/TMAO reductase YedYZ molybdopterin-dependent catalytic subunit
MQRPSVSSGFLLGVASGLLATGVLYVGYRATGLAFAPFDLFEAVTRFLPGAWVTAGIDLIVAVITALGVGPISVAAKIAEKIMAVLLFLGAAGIAGLFAALATRRMRPIVPAAAFAAIGVVGWLGAAAALGRIHLTDALWTAIVLGGAATLLAWSLGRLQGVGDDASVDRAARRRFVGRVVTASAAASTVLLGVGAVLRRRRGTSAAEAPAQVANVTSAEIDAGAARLTPIPGTRPEITPNEHFYRIDINLAPPRIQEATWRLHVEGLVDDPRELTLADLRALPQVTQTITLECISNPLGGDLVSTSRWTGVRLADALRLVRPQARAKTIQMEAADGFFESIALADANDPRIMLVYEMNGVPLPVEHGFPLRIYIPNRHGMKQPKWLTRLRLTEEPGRGYWVERGWSREAIVKTTSVIDTVGASMMLGEAKVVPIGGMAFAGARGISKVEVQVDNGPWEQAELVAPPLGPLTWVLWRYAWTYAPGRHVFKVRAYDGTGALQPTVERGPRPDGASGIHSRTMML